MIIRARYNGENRVAMIADMTATNIKGMFNYAHVKISDIRFEQIYPPDLTDDEKMTLQFFYNKEYTEYMNEYNSLFIFRL